MKWKAEVEEEWTHTGEITKWLQEPKDRGNKKKHDNREEQAAFIPMENNIKPNFAHSFGH